MKKLIYIAILAFGSAAFTACTKENVAPTNKATVLAAKGDLGTADEKGDLGTADGNPNLN
ncbi:hypothetical protein C8P68_10864 [Mucilaginibacter yixingensis]|uniref:Uncharacterized protein n=1 Tax=Mucilaginibacter yixingensis TaxID=1295612 RepID=A0A2T5J5Y8_9SPHI|nr:hypothetical protein [Mucilaginibacter yixingensis]PTQ93602.1 hypothetical protein C8P68_10864 [Mucilaginibacter yixingensis]